MAKTIGRFAVKIGAVTTGFSKGLNRSSKLSAGFGKSLAGLAVKVAGVAAAFLAAKKAFGAVAAQFGDIDKIAKFSKQTGVATESLVAFGHAGSLAGVSGEQVNKGIQRMSRQIGEANAGITTAARGFEMLGLDTEKLAAMSPEQQFGLIADKIKAIKDPAERAAAAYAIFGRSGQDMIPMLMEGSAAMDAARREAEALGMTFSAVDAAKIEQSNDAWHRVKMAVSGVVRMFTVHLAPVFTSIATRFVEVAKLVIAKVREWAPVFMQWTQTTIALFTAVFNTVAAVFQQVFGAIAGPMGGAKDFILDMLIALEFNFRNFGEVMGAVFLNAQVAAVSFGATIKHFFLSTIPALLSWFSRNWFNTWLTANELVTSVLINLAKNIRGLFESIWEFARTGKWEFAFTPLTEGFRNMIQELPQLPEREMGPLETKLRRQAADVEAKIGADFQKFRDKRREELFSAGDKIEIEKPTFEMPVSAGGVAETKSTGPAGAIAALERGSAATFSAISKQIRGAAGKSEDEKNLDANERAADATERVADVLEANPPVLQPVVI